MGHFFVYQYTQAFAGVNHGGEFIVVRRDLFDPAMESIRNIVSSRNSGKNAVDLLHNIANKMLYPQGYISSFEAIKDHKEAHEFEKATHTIFQKEFFEKYANFSTKDIAELKLNEELICSVIRIFLTNTSHLTFELIGGGSIVRIAKKPSAISSFFSTAKTGETIYAFPVKDVTNIECSPEQIKFFKRTDNFMTLTRQRCYFT
ncbi:hypothetical protein MCEMAEM4_02517 [Burkholderiaceae bacterium]